MRYYFTNMMIQIYTCPILAVWFYVSGNYDKGPNIIVFANENHSTKIAVDE